MACFMTVANQRLNPRLPATLLAAALALPAVALAAPPTAGDDAGIARSGPTAGEEITVDVSLNDSDPDSDPLDYQLASGSFLGTVIVSPTGLVRYTAPPGYTGSDVLPILVSDGTNQVISALNITVIANVAPTAGDDTATTTQNATFPSLAAVEIPVLANDTDGDGDVLAYRDLIIVQQPANGTVTQSCLGACNPPEYQPNAGFSGTDSFTYRAVDVLGGQSNLATVTVTVNPANAPPVAGADSGSTRSGPTAGLQVNINAALNDSDPEGDPLSYNLGTPPSNGSVLVSPSGLLRYTPNPGFVGVENFTYTVSDGLNPDVEGNVSVTVVANVAPTAADDSATTFQTAVPALAAIQIPVLANDSDGDGDVLANSGLVIVTQPANGSVSQSCVGACSPPEYRPNANFAGTDTFTYRAVDALGGQSNIATVTVTVTAANAPPIAVTDEGTARSGPAAGEQITINAAANDSDPDGDSLTYALTGGSYLGSASISPSGIITYTPPAGYTGGDSFSYEVSDGVNEPVIAGVNIIVVADVAPVANDDSVSTAEGAPVQVPVLANDNDSDGDTLSYGDVSLVALPANGTVALDCAPTCQPPTYQPNAGFSGTDTFSYQVTDALGAVSNVATVTVAVTATNTPPVAVIAGGNRTIADTDGAAGETVAFDSTSSSDPEGDTLTCLWTVNGVSQSEGCGANVQFALPDGTNVVALQVADTADNVSAVTSVTITVLSNSAPVAVIGGGNRTVADTNGAPGEIVAMDGSASSDSNGTIASYEWTVGGQLVAGASGPRPSLSLQDGANVVGLTVVDNTGARSAPAAVTITVIGANAAPTVVIRVGSTTIPDGDGVAGENVPFEGSATDSDGTVDVSTFRWTVNGQAVASANGEANPVLALQDGANTIALAATDSGGTTGTQSIVVTVGATGALTELPGVSGNENLENTATATDTTCSALLKSDPATLSPEQVNLRRTCDTIYANAEDSPGEVAGALEQISGQQVTAQQSTAIDYTSAQLLNVAGRLTALRQGARGFSAADLNLNGPVSGPPMNALASLGNVLFGSGGSSGEEDGGLLDDRLGIFVNGSVRFGDKDATARESGFDFDTLGVTAGVDYRFTDELVAGVAFGYGNASATFDAKGGSQDSDSYSGSLYGSWYGRRSYVDGIVSIGTVSYDTVRNINLFNGAIVDQALGSTDGIQLALGMASGMDFGTGGLRFGPNVALNYIKVDIDGFRERTTGTSGLAMAFGDQSADSLTLKAGAHFNYSYSRKWGILSPQARFDIVREFANDAQRISVRYANDATVTAPGGAGGSFVVFTDDPDEYYFLWAVGFAAQFMNGFSGFIDYEQTEALDTITTGEFSFGLRYQTKFR